MNTGTFGVGNGDKGMVTAEAGSQLSKRLLAAIFAIVFAVILIITAVIVMATTLSGSKGKGVDSFNVNNTPSASSPPTTQSGVIDIEPGVWRGVTCSEGDKNIDGKILNDNVHWMVRLDKDDARVYKLYPRNWDPKKVLDIRGNANIMEWMVEPKEGQETTRAKVLWTIGPKRIRGNPS